MKKCDRVLAGVAVCLLLVGCISTTSGPSKPEVEADDAAELNYQLGARYFRNGKFALARDRLILAVELNPKLAIAYSTLALTYEQLGNLRLAGVSYDQALRVDPRNYAVLNTYAVFLCRQNRFDAALNQFDRAVKVLENDNAEITLTNAGVCMVQKPDYARAEVFFRQALQRRPDFGEALLQMSALKHSVKDDLIARAFLQRFLASNMAAADVLYLGWQIEVALGDKRAQKEFADRILREFPGSAEARRILDAS